MAELAAVVTPAPYKVKKKDPEKMLGDFKVYIVSVKNMINVTGKKDVTADVKKSLLMVGGMDMATLFKHVGKVLEEDTYEPAVAKIEEAIKAMSNRVGYTD